jgi:hypothetical protein
LREFIDLPLDLTLAGGQRNGEDGVAPERGYRSRRDW